eukprot:Amastigsp_a177767_5.p2 type:complete len:118 gc:universal Amastigsp_a177767_5:108-461(+)
MLPKRSRARATSAARMSGPKAKNACCTNGTASCDSGSMSVDGGCANGSSSATLAVSNITSKNATTARDASTCSTMCPARAHRISDSRNSGLSGRMTSRGTRRRTLMTISKNSMTRSG